jgi:hypothetical protein
MHRVNRQLASGVDAAFLGGLASSALYASAFVEDPRPTDTLVWELELGFRHIIP